MHSNPRDNISSDPSNVTSHPSNVSNYPSDVGSHPGDVSRYPSDASSNPGNVGSYPSNASSYHGDVSSSATPPPGDAAQYSSVSVRTRQGAPRVRQSERVVGERVQRRVEEVWDPQLGRHVFRTVEYVEKIVETEVRGGTARMRGGGKRHPAHACVNGRHCARMRVARV